MISPQEEINFATIDLINGYIYWISCGTIEPEPETKRIRILAENVFSIIEKNNIMKRKLKMGENRKMRNLKGKYFSLMLKPLATCLPMILSYSNQQYN